MRLNNNAIAEESGFRRVKSVKRCTMMVVVEN